MNERFSKYLTPEQAFAKAKHYCSYQERSHVEVKEKLYGYKLKKLDVETILTQLIEEGYLNEERFARQFVGGKFRIKKWGRVKIIYELKQKRVSSFNIKTALQDIDEDEYYTTLQKLLTAKWRTLKNDQHYLRRAKAHQYLLQKGYESNLVKKAISELERS